MSTPAPAHADVSVPCNNITALNNAINNANNGGDSKIKLAHNCTYHLTTVAETGRGANGLRLIRRSLTIEGNGATLQRDVGSPAFRILENRGGTLTLRNLTIKGGDSGAETGGGVLIDGSTALNTWAVRFTGNQGDNGAGLSGDKATVTLRHSVISGNTAAGGGAGGVYNDGTLVLDHTPVLNNIANTGGGGVYNEQGGSTTVRNSIIRGNKAVQGFGGGIVNGAGSTVRVSDTSTVADNTAGTHGGGVYNAGHFYYGNGTIARNVTATYGGGIYNKTGGDVWLTHAFILRNTATDGGGIYNAAGPGAVHRTKTQITGNTPNNCVPPGCS